MNSNRHYRGVPTTRRQFVLGLSAGAMSAAMGLRLGYAANPAPGNGPIELKGSTFDLTYSPLPVNITGRDRFATAINGSVPAPVLRWQEGDTVTLKVTNHLADDTSIHWHGIILPSGQDGVPNISDGFKGIKPGDSFTYRFKLGQSGTYWYHSHSGFQEQTGAYGAIIVDPIEPDPFDYDRDYAVVLSDWSDENPHRIYSKLKKVSHFYNFRERTFGDTMDHLKRDGWSGFWSNRGMWNQMRMSDRDISDVTGYTYTFLMNGVAPAEGWKALFSKGEKVRLRFINAAAMTFFDVRIPGLDMTVVAADGQNIEPVTVEEMRIGVAETYDVIVKPSDDRAYTLFAQAIDRTGYARGTLTPDLSLTAEIPDMDPAPILTHGDMGMAGHAGHDMSGMDHGAHAGHTMTTSDSDPHAGHNMGTAGDDPHAGHNMGAAGSDAHAGHTMSATSDDPHAGHDMSAMGQDDHAGHNMGATEDDPHAGHNMSGASKVMKYGSGKAGFGSARPVIHAPSEYGPHVDMRAETPQYLLDDPGIGLRNNGRRVLTYADIFNLWDTPDPREPSREIDLHLTGNMSRYMWSVNGIKFADAEPLHFKYGERLRINLINDTMMNHPIHLHGMWSDLETGDGKRIPRKHTVIVQPGAKVSYLVTADAMGGWAYHCHLIFHMPGMFRTVIVS